MSTKLKPCCSREALRQLNSSTYVDTAALLRRPLHSTQHAAGVYRNSHSHLNHQETAPLCSMYLIVAVKVEQLICMPLFIYLIVASEVKELMGEEFHTCGIRISLQHRPKQTPCQDINYKHSLQNTTSLSNQSLLL